MRKTHKELMLYINDNVRFGSTINQKYVDNWFKEYKLNYEQKLSIYDELDELQIKFIDHPKSPLKIILFKLYKSISKNDEVERDVVVEWLSHQHLDVDTQSKIISDLKDNGYLIVDENENVIDDKVFEDLFNDLDAQLSNDEFFNSINLLEDVIDKSKNQEYIKQFNSNNNILKEQALNNLVQANKRLVWKVVKKYEKYSTVGFDLNDMYQIGMIGLIKAADKFDSSLDNQFSTYAVWWIRQAITRGISDYSSLIRIPVYYREKMYKFIKVENQLLNELSRRPTHLEIAEVMEESLEGIEELSFHIAQIKLDSLDRLVGEEDKTSLGELALDSSFNTPDQEYLKLELKKTIFKVIQENLKERESEVLISRFGLVGGQPKTLEEIGQKFNVTRERIRQIEARALLKLKNRKCSEILKEYLYEN